MELKFLLQLFADPNTQTTTKASVGNDLSSTMKTFYKTSLLENARTEHFFTQFGQKQPLPKNEGKKVEWRKFDTFGKAMTPLTEGVTPDGRNINMTKIEKEISQYGDYATISDRLELEAVDPIIMATTEEFGAQAGDTLDTVTRNEVITGTNVIYAGSKTSRSALTASDKITPTLVDQAFTFLKKMKAPKIGNCYVAIIHPSVAYDLRENSDWTDVHKYAEPTEIFNGEIGMLHNVRFVESTEQKVYVGEPLTAAAANLTVKTAIDAATKDVAVYVNLYDQNDVGKIRCRFTSDEDITITYTICDASGNDFDNITASDTAPENPSDGDYWLCTLAGSQGLNIYVGSQSMWQPVATSYLRIDIPGANLTDYFKKDDTVNMNTSVDDINNGSQIVAMTDTSLVVMGILTDAVQKEDHTSSSWKLYVERKIPQLDYVCADKNRLWGCHYGWQDGQMVNEIYASKLGDFKNWYAYQGLTTDSYAASIGVPGNFTGCISFQGNPIFFKENAIFKVYGSYPAEYQIIESDQRGVQEGSFRSLAIVDEYLVYKSATDICAYDGSSPIGISDQLGRECMFYDAVGGGCQGKYRVFMEDAKARRYYFVYDFRYGLWEKEDAQDVFKQFSGTENGQIYGATNREVYGLGTHDNMLYSQSLVSEEWVEWYAVTGEMGYEYPDYKYVQRLTLRAYVPSKSELKLEISYNDRPFEEIGTIRGSDQIESQSLAFNPFRCDHFRIRLSGHGDCRIYTLAFTLDTGSEEDGY